jgi:hypothetical protein
MVIEIDLALCVIYCALPLPIGRLRVLFEVVALS